MTKKKKQKLKQFESSGWNSEFGNLNKIKYSKLDFEHRSINRVNNEKINIYENNLFRHQFGVRHMS